MIKLILTFLISMDIYAGTNPRNISGNKQLLIMNTLMISITQNVQFRQNPSAGYEYISINIDFEKDANCYDENNIRLDLEAATPELSISQIDIIKRTNNVWQIDRDRGYSSQRFNFFKDSNRAIMFSQDDLYFPRRLSLTREDDVFQNANLRIKKIPTGFILTEYIGWPIKFYYTKPVQKVNYHHITKCEIEVIL